MNTLRSAIIGQVVLLGSLASVFAQGNLNPPGPPAPMMKTLQQVEPRVPIESLPYTIGAPGSYYLTDNLSGTAGIVIKADNVTIDLRGFALLGAGSSSGGIEVVANVSGLSVYNGTISGWNGNGIEASMASDSQFSKLRLSSNSGSGVTAGKGCSISDCVVASNAKPGIEVDSSCYVNGNTCRANDGSGIHVLGTVNRIDSNHLTEQTGNGIKVDGSRNLIIRNSACNNSMADYAIASGNDYGQILYTPGANFTSTVTWANFGCSNAPAGCTIDSECNDNNPCTADTCNIMDGSCVNSFVPNGTACPNGTCQEGVCTPQSCTSNADCNDNDPCTTDTCQMSTCVHTPVPNCNGTCASDSDCSYLTSGCTMGVCSGGVCAGVPRPTGTSCNDNSPCTINDVCDGTGGCAGTPVNCNDNNPCTTDSCDGMSGGCIHAYVADGTSCPGGVCMAGICQTGPATCGNGIVEAGETCDDANTTMGDGCSATCQVEPGYVCTGGPSACMTICGDGITTGAEQCDDGNTTSGDGCSATCQTESGCTTSSQCAYLNTQCTQGACVANQCVNQPKPTGTACNDGNGCTINDVCDGTGVCTGSNGAGQACNTGQPGNCSAGTMVCQGGSLVCVGNVSPTAEVCDGQDNNCNGQVDEGFGTLTCGTGQCQRTVQACSGGVVQTCTPGSPSVEVCDGLDNNCNGTTDEGDPGGGTACSTGLPGVCAAGVRHCISGSLVCVQNTSPSAEVCDGQDNNCNGSVDEGNPGGGQACSTGQLGICSAGTTACQSGTIQCIRNNNPIAEVCNGLDDNCDGIVDNGANCGVGKTCSNGVCVSL